MKAAELEFLEVKTDEDIKLTEHIADVTWHEHYEKIIDKKQIDYMIDKFQTADAIRSQIKSQGYRYFLVKVNDINIGYLGVVEEPEDNRLFLSKIYLLKEYRGMGYGTGIFEYAEKMAAGKGYNIMWLTVNRNNSSSVAVYEKKGFIKVRTQVADIGNGFVMDDYIMEKKVESN